MITDTFCMEMARRGVYLAMKSRPYTLGLSASAELHLRMVTPSVETTDVIENPVAFVIGNYVRSLPQSTQYELLEHLYERDPAVFGDLPKKFKEMK